MTDAFLAPGPEDRAMLLAAVRQNEAQGAELRVRLGRAAERYDTDPAFHYRVRLAMQVVGDLPNIEKVSFNEQWNIILAILTADDYIAELTKGIR